MNKLFYKITAWILMVTGVIYAITNLYLSFGGPTIADRIYELGFGFLFSVLIFILLFFLGKYFMTIGEDKTKQNKLTNSSLVLTMIGIVLILVEFFAMLIMCPPPCDGMGFLFVLFFGVIPVGVLYTMAIILLLINKFKK